MPPPLSTEFSPLGGEISTIMNTFDFNRMQAIMLYLGWEWGSSNANVPTVLNLRETAEKLLLDTVEEWNTRGSPPTGYSMRTGGFLVMLTVDQVTKRPRLVLSFSAVYADS